MPDRAASAPAGTSAGRLLDRGLKRALDLAVSVAALVLASPIIAGAALAIRLTMGSPVLFTQERLGFRGRPFRVYKFRTMRSAGAGPWDPARDGERLTPLGRALRRWSVDELPQLLNVVRGDMSLVGPRPLPVEYGPRYSREQFRRHDVLPGITGWAQVNGRNAATWEERFRLDVWYADNRTLLLDLRILAATLSRVVTGEGVAAPGAATMTEFRG